MQISPENLQVLRDCAKNVDAYEMLLALFERTVSQTSAFLQAEIDAMDAEVAVLDQNGIVIAVNAAWRHYADDTNFVPLNYGLGINYFDVCERVEGEDAQTARHAADCIREVLEGRATKCSFDYPCHIPGREQWFSMTASQFILDNQHYVVVSHHDITKRVIAERQLQHNQALYQLLVRNLPHNAVFLFDRDLRYTFAEGEGIKVSGHNPEAFIGKTLWDLFPPDIAERDESSLRAALEGHTTTAEVNFGEHWYFVQTLPVRDIDGVLVGGMVVTQDITLLKQAEQIRLQKNLLEAELEKERAISQFKTRLMGRITHEFRTPLSVIQSSTDMLEQYQSRMTEEMRQERIKHIQEEIRQLSRLLSDIALMNKTQTHTMTLQPSEFDLTALGDEVIQNVRMSLDARQQFVTAYTLAQPFITADRALLKAALINLLSNAVKYSDPETEIRVQIFASGANAIIKVIDHGIGIDAQELPQVTEAFFRAANSQSVNGMGLGLSIVKEIVDLHNGCLLVESKLGVGTSVTIQLPITNSAVHLN
jgi:PAS domain S-box-containing protein